MHICIYVFFHEQVLMNVIKKDYSKVRGWREPGCFLRPTRKVHSNQSAEQRPVRDWTTRALEGRGSRRRRERRHRPPAGGCRAGMRQRGGRGGRREMQGEVEARYRK